MHHRCFFLFPQEMQHILQGSRVYKKKAKHNEIPGSQFRGERIPTLSQHIYNRKERERDEISRHQGKGGKGDAEDNM